MRFLIVGLLSLIPLFQVAATSFAADAEHTQTMAVLPLEVSQTGQYAYLNRAINQMLISRLSGQAGLEVVGSQMTGTQVAEIKELLLSGNYAKAVSLVEADWLVNGSMYSLKDGLQVNLTLYPTAAGLKPLNFGFNVEGPDGVIPAIAELSVDIREGVLPDDTSKAEGTSAQTDGLSGFQTPHPERAYKKGLYAGAALFGGEGDDRFQSKGVRKSSTIPLTVESVALGDLDGDGENELVAASRSKIRIFRFDDRRFNIVAEYDFHPGMKIHVVNIADPGDSGRMRLYVSANEGKFPSSSIFTWDGSKDLQMVQQRIRWYIRPIWWPKKGVILAGQQDSPNISDNFLMPGVFELAFDSTKGRFVRREKLLLPEKTNLFDFVVADLDGNGTNETIVIDKLQKLLVYDEVLNLTWVSSANYGGSKQFFGPPIADEDKHSTSSYDDVIQGLRKLVFIPGRLEVKDITGDGLPEVVVTTNEIGMSEWMDNIRSYDGGSVACLTWRGFGLMELWRTNHITGYVADHAFDGDGRLIEGEDSVFLNRLYVVQVPDVSMWESVLPGSDASKILAYEMTVKKE